jgi:hypothetical protein
VVKEVLHIGAEALQSTARHEAVDLHATVGANMKVPIASSDVDGACVAADGVGVVVSAEP